MGMRDPRRGIRDLKGELGTPKASPGGLAPFAPLRTPQTAPSRSPSGLTRRQRGQEQRAEHSQGIPERSQGIPGRSHGIPGYSRGHSRGIPARPRRHHCPDPLHFRHPAEVTQEEAVPLPGRSRGADVEVPGCGRAGLGPC